MCQIICFFLENGFDVTRFNDCYGTQCLEALTLSTFDRYMIEATKILFDARAKNRPTSPDGAAYTSPIHSIGTEGSFQATCEHDHALPNIFSGL